MWMPGGTNSASPLREKELAADDQHEPWWTQRDQRLHVKWRQGHRASWMCRLLWGLFQLEARQEYGSHMVMACSLLSACTHEWTEMQAEMCQLPLSQGSKKYNLKVEKRGDPAASHTLGRDSPQSRRMRKLIRAMGAYRPLQIQQRGLQKVCLVLWEIGVSVT